MEDLLKKITDFKNRAKTSRDIGRYNAAVKALKEGAIPAIKDALASAPPAWKIQLASELSDCDGILGGIYRRWALQQGMEEDERRLHLQQSVDAYEEGSNVEQDPQYRLTNSYNMLNRLVSYILLRPGSLSGEGSDQLGPYQYHVKDELAAAESALQEQLKEKRRGDIWALADMALIRLLLSEDDPATAYAEFNAKAPPAFAYDSVLSTLRPLAEAETPVKGRLQEAVTLLEGKLAQVTA